MCNEKTPTGVLAEIINRLATITDDQIAAVGPKYEVEEGVDTVVGEADDHVKRLFTLAKLLQAELKMSLNALKGLVRDVMAKGKDGTDYSVLDPLNAQCAEIKSLLKVVQAIMWLEVRRHPELRYETQIGFRVGWQLCSVKVEKEKFFADICAGIAFGIAMPGAGWSLQAD